MIKNSAKLKFTGKKKKKVLKVSLNRVNNPKSMEVLMPQELIDKLFADEHNDYDYAENEESIDRKQRYNKDIIKKIKNIRFTERQVTILNYLYGMGYTLTEAAKELSVRVQTIERIRNEAIAKIKKKIVYNFRYTDLEN